MATTATKNKDTYHEGLGRRKTATARVRLFSDSKNNFVINDGNLEDYFTTGSLRQTVREALDSAPEGQTYRVSVKVSGGGTTAQAEAIRLGIARALVTIDESLRPDLKHSGFLKRDPRKKERKKPGLRKARKRPQWSKR